jgi:trehalose 6-phosphate synthase
MRRAFSRSTTDRAQVIVVSNREPYRHERDTSGLLREARSASGVVNAIEPLIQEASGVWIAEGIGAADREAAVDRDGLDVPSHAPRYRLRRVFLAADERMGYYDGFSNGALWPLCHRTAVEPVYAARDFHAYELVNRRFADAVSDEARRPAPLVLVQDYHFALAPQLIRRQLPLSRIGVFWHVPWPRLEAFRSCPWSRAILEGLLGATTVAFQTEHDARYFLAAIEQLTSSSVDHATATIRHRGRTIGVAVHPVSIDWPGPSAPPVAECRRAVCDELGLPSGVALGVGVDRMDYTKGLEQKFLALERLLDARPDLVGRVVFAQLAEPTREALPAYRATRLRVRETAARVNRRFGDAIRLIEAHHAPEVVTRYLRAADFCYVGSLHDGMNLVGKEFVRARDDDRGVLVLSQHAGAAETLGDSLLVNPFDTLAVARALETALAMPADEQRARMRRLRRTVESFTATDWAHAVLADLADDASITPAWRLTRPAAPLITRRRWVASDASAS